MLIVAGCGGSKDRDALKLAVTSLRSDFSVGISIVKLTEKLSNIKTLIKVAEDSKSLNTIQDIAANHLILTGVNVISALSDNFGCHNQLNDYEYQPKGTYCDYQMKEHLRAIGFDQKRIEEIINTGSVNRKELVGETLSFLDKQAELAESTLK
ncbi:hypothetical protein FBZ90_1135 [Nitrospirillum pindoramense]|uniref:Uncharacterized protein n=2 Tax=Nitrospirillum amazonense TaxID=28077 RepID=A0A560GWV8_9PROT|nr:hypothetical protein FBZ90_1135 [Nitrospirillum amazonense]